MTNSEKISKCLKVLLRESFDHPTLLYKTLLRTSFIEGKTFEVQYYFNSFYINFTYAPDGITMFMYTDRWSKNCDMICFERTGDIIIGQALSDTDLKIYNGCKPGIRELNVIGLDMTGFDCLVQLLEVTTPVLNAVADYLRKYSNF